MMIIAWVLFTGILTIISRYFKSWMPEKKLCGTKVWFQIHRELAVMTAIFTGIGLAVIFAHYGGGIRETSCSHAYVGFAVTGCVGLQILTALIRPGPDHKLRPVFNWGHRFLGIASQILAAATMFLAYDIRYVSRSSRLFGRITLSIWVVNQVIWFIIFEIIKCRTRSSDKSNRESGEKPSSKLDVCLLAIYIICIAILCVTVLLSFLFY